MPYQNAQDVSVRYKVQSAKGTPATGTGGKELPLIASGGMVPAKAAISSPEVRSDGMTTVGRHGTRSAAGSYTAVGRVGALDEIFEATMRSTWTASAAITNTAMTSITTTTNTIVAAAGSWITQGVRVGDVVRLTDHSTTANNNKNLLVTAVTALVITVPAGSLVLDAAADSTFTLTVLKRIGMGTTQRYFTIDEYHATIDQSEQFTDVMFTSMAVAMQADDTVRVTIGAMGLNWAAMSEGASPVLTSPTQYETPNLVATDAVILKNGVAVADLTGFTFNLDMRASGLAVVGSVVGPDIFPNNATISGSITLPRADLTYLQDFDTEAELSLHFLLREPGAEPRGCTSFFFPVIKLMTAPDAALGGDGPMLSSVNFEAGKKPVTSGFLPTMLQISSSAA